MREKNKRHTLIRAAAVIFDAVMLSYHFIFWYLSFKSDESDSPILDSIILINPMTEGAYLLGTALLLHLKTFKNIAGRCLMIISYLLSIVLSLIGMMGMTTLSDMHYLIPHIPIIIAAALIIARQHRSSANRRI